MESAVQMFIGLGTPATVIVLLFWFRTLERLRAMAVVRAAAEAQQAMSPEAIRALTGGFATPPRERDRRRGVMLVSICGAFAMIGVLACIGSASMGFDGAVAVGVALAGIGAIPGCVGGAYVILSKGEREDGDD